MRTSLFTYDLNPSFIAQHPPERRTDARLLVLHRRTGRLEHRHFSEIGEYLRPQDLLVLNDTRVFPARLEGRKESGGKVEALLLKKEGREWEALVHPSYRVREGARLTFHRPGPQANGAHLAARVVDAHRPGAGTRHLRFTAFENFWARLEKVGRTPLPPYIKRDVENGDRDRYQTVFARRLGAVAAPTAGLHFTEELLEDLRARGARTAFVTLHVGYGTFKPVTAERLEDHAMHAEYFEVGARAARAIRAARRVIACGSTALRALEASCGRARKGWTDLFIYPPYRFGVVDALITNFHLPRSTLLMLVSAFAGRSAILRAYAEAKRHGYRFYSYGDAMLIL